MTPPEAAAGADLPQRRAGRRSQVALLTALGVDNFGSGLFLPLTIVYVTRVAGLPLGMAGTVVALGTLAGLAVPPVAGRLVDRAGPRPVVISSQLLQALGASAYLVAHAAVVVLIAAVLLAAGQQTFYSSLFALVSDVSGSGPKDRAFAVANMVRSASFGLGGLLTGAVLVAAGPVAYRIAIAADAASFAACSLLLALLVRPPRQRAGAGAALPGAPAATAPSRVLTDRPFLALVLLTGLVVLPVDFFLSGTPVFVLEQLRAPSWLPGTILVLSTTLNSGAATVALRATRRLTRISAMQLGAVLYALWCAASLAAAAVPPAWRPAELLGATVVMAAAGLVCGPRAVALVAAVAPEEARGRYLAAFQYAFTVSAVIAPAVVALYSVDRWLPWTLVAAGDALAVIGLGVLARHLPAIALNPEETADAGDGAPQAA
jgi:MFS family permease